jgi:hypothetical protein
MIHTYLARPLVGIVPNPRVVKELRERVNALIKEIPNPRTIIIKGFAYPLSFFSIKSL